MITLSTKTKELTTPQLRKIVWETLLYMKENVGTKQKFSRLKYQVLTLPKGYTPAYGSYDPDTNSLVVYKNHAHDVKMVVRSVLHEYTHFLQNLRYYHLTLSKVGYNAHPLEKQARAMEHLYSECWKEIKRKVNC